MNTEVNSTNPTVKAIISGAVRVPPNLLPPAGFYLLPQSDLLEILVSLAESGDEELSTSARQTLASQNSDELESNIKSDQLAPKVLSYFAVQENLPVPVYEAILNDLKTPHEAIASFA